MASDFICDLTAEQRVRVRDNWTVIGYAYWFTADMIEYWRHPVTDHVAEMAIY